MNNTRKMGGSGIDPYYISGAFIERSKGAGDAQFKIEQLESLWTLCGEQLPGNLTRVADIGCGSGDTTILLRAMLRRFGYEETIVEGYDVHPDIADYSSDATLKFYQADFCVADIESIDFAIVFDVLEHVPDPIVFLKQIVERVNVIVFHIPLDNSLFSWIRNLPKENLRHPGHLVNLDPSSALNLLTMGGARIVDFMYTPVFRAPSGRERRAQRILNVIRSVLYKVSPYLLQRTLGGVSLMVLAISPKKWNS